MLPAGATGRDNDPSNEYRSETAIVKSDGATTRSDSPTGIAVAPLCEPIVISSRSNLAGAVLPVENRLRSRIDRFLAGYGLTAMGKAVAVNWIQVGAAHGSSVGFVFGGKIQADPNTCNLSITKPDSSLAVIAQLNVPRADPARLVVRVSASCTVMYSV